MEINIHQRTLNCPINDAAELIDSLAQKNSILWPSLLWPRELFKEPLAIGVIGAHGGTEYVVEEYIPGRSVSFKFLQPKAYKGFHRFELSEIDSGKTLIKHTTQFNTHGIHLILWRYIIQWVHNALIEDAFDCAEKSLGLNPTNTKWPLRVYGYRYLLGSSRLVSGTIKKIFNHTTQNRRPLYNNLVVNPLCKVIIGFRNYTTHATRSRYISFALDKEPAMCQLLLELADKSLKQETINLWPNDLFNILINYGLFKTTTTITEKTKNWLRNPVNENRKTVINYRGKQYWVTSFIFMAFNSQPPKQFIRETVILPFWSRSFAWTVFKLIKEGFNNSFYNKLPMSTLQRLLKHGVLVYRHDYPEVYEVFSRTIQLTPQLTDSIPENYLITNSTKLGSFDWIVNQEVYFWEDCPPAWHTIVYNLDWIKEVRPTIILKDPITQTLSIYWLQNKHIQILKELQKGMTTPADLDSETLKLFSSIFILETRWDLEQRAQQWQTQIIQAKQELEEKNQITFRKIIPPGQLAIARQYIRHLFNQKYLIFDKANGGTKKRFWQHRDDFTFFIQSQVCTILNQILISPVKIGHNALTVYQPGAVLPKHKDDVLAFSWVMSIPIDTTPLRTKEEAWPIYTEYEEKKVVEEAMLEMGDAILINPQNPHWRDELKDHELSILFLWFVPQSFQGYVNGNWVE